MEIKGFHAHVYFDGHTKDQAARVREQLSQFDVELGRWRDQAFGPHPKGMYQVAFAPSEFGKIVPWLMLNRQGLDILVHPETGDDLGDHFERCLWLGCRLELNADALG